MAQYSKRELKTVRDIPAKEISTSNILRNFHYISREGKKR